MKQALGALIILAAAGAFAQDQVQLHSGKAANCRVIRYASGMFVCEMADGQTNQVAAYNVKAIDFDAAGTAPGAVETADTLKGRFYVAVVEAAKLYVNGKLVHTATANSFSEETTLSPGDLVVADVEHWQFQPYLKLAFMTADRRLIVNFKANEFRDLGVQPIADVTPDTVAKAQTRVQKVKEANQTPLLPQPIKDNSDAVWGTGKHCLLGTRITREMIAPIK